MLAVTDWNTLSSADAATVLHVEDDEQLGNAVRALLQFEGYSSIRACGLDEAMACVTGQGLRPDVLLVDYHLNGPLTGAAVAEHLARVLGYPLPTVVLTADLDKAEAPWMPGAPVLLGSKPIDSAVLLDTIQHFFHWHRFERARCRTLSTDR